MLSTIIERFTGAGTTTDRACVLGGKRLPWFICVGGALQGSPGPIFLRVEPFSAVAVYRYGIQNYYNRSGGVFYLEWNQDTLPQNFWVKRVRSRIPMFTVVSRDEAPPQYNVFPVDTASFT